VDEVLAVGDVRFQRKCLGKMGDVARAGRTVVLVSHNMGAISALCSRCIILDHGYVEFEGVTGEATARYYTESSKLSDGSDLSKCSRQGSGKARFTAIDIQPLSPSGERIEHAYPGCSLSLDITLECHARFSECNLAVIFYDSSGYRIIDTNTAQKNEFVTLNGGQIARANFVLREVLLRPGKYFVGLWLGRDYVEVIDHVEHAVTIDVVESEETKLHSVIFPGTYLCRFENSVRIS
jgi:lipopolysaccharide transport system ATP-binding protein